MTVDQLLARIYDSILEPLLFALFGVAVIIFIWGVIEFIRNSDSDDGREKGRNNIIWGMVGMVIMVSVFGIINIIIGTIGADKPANYDDVKNKFQGTQELKIEEGL